MSTHPLNHALRFMLEIAALVIFGFWGYDLSDSWTGILWAILLPMLFAAVWGVFAVQDDPSRSGKTVVPTPGVIRLVLELILFAAATWTLIGLEKPLLGCIFGGVVLLHYIISYDRIAWLLKPR